MIISASSRTDIPAFYGEWFQNRIKAGYCLSVNAFNGSVYRIGLGREEVDGFFFWTKNLGPFLPHLDMLNSIGFPFVIHYTINGYPRILEPLIIPTEQAVGHLRQIAEKYGRKVGVWRYDPIIITNRTDFNFHRENFTRLARALAGIVDEVAVAYASYTYRKTRRKMNLAAKKTGIHWEDPEEERKRKFIIDLSTIARDNGITLRLCAQPQYLSPSISEAVCINARRLSEIAKRPIIGKKPGHRGKQCACDYSRDIGAYDTCMHGCIYCYAVADFQTVKRYYRQHDPTAEWLRPPQRLVERKQSEDLPLFCWDHQ